MTQNWTGGFISFSENKWARRAFEEPEKKIYDAPVMMTPSSSAKQESGFQGFMVASGLKLLAGILRHHVPGLSECHDPYPRPAPCKACQRWQEVDHEGAVMLQS